VPNISIGIPVLKAVRAITRLPVDAHLMITEPERYVGAFVEAGADSVSVHTEVCRDLGAMAARIRAAGARASIAINPETAPDRVLACAEQLDMILVMSVHPGFSGQEFIADSLDKVRSIRRDLERRGIDLDIEIDGGIKVDNVAAAAEAGANVFVSGSGIFGHRDYVEIISQMRAQIARI
jgi:ribulose-phosphate 3-epimerase